MTKIKSSLSDWGRALAGLILSSLVAGSTLAANATPNHSFDILADLKPGEVFRQQWGWRVNATAISNRPTCVQRDPGLGRPDGGVTPFFVPPSSGSEMAIALCPAAFGLSSSSFEAMANGKNSHDVFAFATVDGPGPAFASAYALSKLGYQVGTKSRRGTIRWTPGWRVDTLSAFDVAARGSDPIELAFLNLDTGEIQSSTLWDSQVTLAGKGLSAWENGRIQVDGLNGEFFVTLESPYITSGTGSMRLQFEGGLVILSEDSGIFDGLLPSIGALAQLDMAFGDAMGTIDIDFDFGADNTNGFDLTAVVSSDAEASAAVPEPASLWLAIAALLGLMRCRRSASRGAHQPRLATSVKMS